MVGVSVVIALSTLVVMVVGTRDPVASGPGYVYYCTGNCSNVEVSPKGGMVFMGGGTDVDEAYVWLVGQADSGNILILRSGPPGDDAYDSYIFQLAKCQSVATLIINDTVANHQHFVIDTIMQADALYFAGGDQSTYVNYWSGSISKAINARVAMNVPVGGTSAGMAVLASDCFTAETGGVDSTEALNLPLSSDITLSDDFLHLYPKVIAPLVTDMHFVVRDRMGRLIAFLANAIHRGWRPPHGLACNEKTALLLDTTTGIARLVGQGPAYALSYTSAPSVLEPETPLSWSGINCQRLSPNDTFNFYMWEPVESVNKPYTLNVDDGNLSSEGNNGKIY